MRYANAKNERRNNVKKSLLERMEEAVGRIVAYDGRLMVWTERGAHQLTAGTHDLRDILPKIKGAKLGDLQAALPKALQLATFR
jgi:hypothetical protein